MLLQRRGGDVAQSWIRSKMRARFLVHSGEQQGPQTSMHATVSCHLYMPLQREPRIVKLLASSWPKLQRSPVGRHIIVAATRRFGRNFPEIMKKSSQ